MSQLALRLREGPVKKPFLIGELNPYGADPEFALYPLPDHASGGRLARILGLTRSEYLRTFERRNLCTGKWSMPVARAEAYKILSESLREKVSVVLLGRKVAAAFDCDYIRPFEDRESAVCAGRKFVCLPHPSGLNRVWNQPDAVERARLAVMKAIWGGS